MSLHYLVKFECSTIQLYKNVIHFRSVQNRYLEQISITDDNCMLQYYNIYSKCSSPLSRTLCFIHSIDQWMHQWRAVQYSTKLLAGVEQIKFQVTLTTFRKQYRY